MREYALIGHPLEHSKSAEFFNAKFTLEQIEARYVNIDLDTLTRLRLMLLRHPLLRGFNVTSPYKQAITKFLTEVDIEAQYTGAVNTVVVKRTRWGKRHLIGFNTDIEGFSQSIQPLLKPRHKRALILGTGGGALAVARALKKLGVDSKMASRRINYLDTIGYDQITPEVIGDYNIIVNATTLGMSPHVLIAPTIPYEAITPAHLCYDLIYSPEETRFLSLCKAQGATIKNGIDMLLIQANEAWNIWQTFED